MTWLTTPDVWRHARKVSSSAVTVRASSSAYAELDLPVQQHRLVDEVTVQVEQQATALGRPGGLTPALLRHGTPAVPTVFGPPDLAYELLVAHDAQRRELGVETPVVEDGEGHAVVGRLVDDVEGGAGVDGERLVDDEGQAGLDDLLGLLGVHPARRREHDEVERVDTQQRFEVGHDLGVRQVGTHLLGARRVGRRHGCDTQPGPLDEGSVDAAAG